MNRAWLPSLLKDTRPGPTQSARSSELRSLLASLVERQARLSHESPDLSLIPWTSPVLAFGCAVTSRIATVGLNPSNREFVDAKGNELSANNRRLPTLSSLGIDSWSQAEAHHLERILHECDRYFDKNPYSGWFKILDSLLEGTGCSLYGPAAGACHLDIVPFATAKKWSSLGIKQRSGLVQATNDALGVTLKASPIQVLVLNGASVVREFEVLAGKKLDQVKQASWALQQKGGPGPIGVGYSIVVDKLAGEALGRDVLVLGYNHNLQNAHGLTLDVREAIGAWVTNNVEQFSKAA